MTPPVPDAFPATRGAVSRFSTLMMVLAVLAGCARLAGTAPDPLVTTDTGRLRGARLDGVLAFRGIWPRWCRNRGYT